MRDNETNDPHELARLYEQAHDAATAAKAAGAVPASVEAQWPNLLGVLRRLPGQPYHRPGPNGREDPPDAWALRRLRHALLVTKRRCEEALKD